MSSKKILCGCGSCKAVWPETIPLPMLVDVFVNRFSGMQCPKCGGRNVLVTVKERKPRQKRIEINREGKDDG